MLSSPSVSFIARTRTITSFPGSISRISRQTPSVLFQKRWATNDTEAKNDDAPISKLQPTPLEEVENAVQEDAGNLAAADPTEEAQSDIDESRPADVVNDGGKEPAPKVTSTQSSAPTGADALEEAAKTSFQTRSDSSRFAPKPTVYVGNLFFDVTEDDLEKEFSRFGEIQKVRVIRDARGLSKGFAYVTFASTEFATKAITGQNQQLFEGRRLSVQYASTSTAPPSSSEPRGPKNPPSKTLFIGNMSWEMTDRDLNNLFRGIRNVIDVRVAIDRRTGQPRGFAHADFIDIKSAMEAKTLLEAKEVYGRRLRLDYSYSSNAAPRNQARDEAASSS